MLAPLRPTAFRAALGCRAWWAGGLRRRAGRWQRRRMAHPAGERGGQRLVGLSFPFLFLCALSGQPKITSPFVAALTE